MFHLNSALEDDKDSVDSSDREYDDSCVIDHDGLDDKASDNEDFGNEESVYSSETQGEEEDDEDAERESDAEEGSEDEAAASTDSTSSTFVAKDKTVWNKTSQPNCQTPARNIVSQKSGPHRSTEMLSFSGIFKKFITLKMVDIIVRCTNIKAEAVYQDYNSKHPQKEPRVWKKVTVTEMYSFFGILICAGANNSNTDNVDEMWKTNALPLYRATMGRRRFQSLLRFIRFDDHSSRLERATNDKAAPIADIWNMLNANLAAMYRPTKNLTIDEQLFALRGITKFTQYMPSKPPKYGLKVFWLCDASNAYPLKGILYTGKQGNTREVNQGEQVVKELVATYKGSCRNIITNKFFTTLSLAENLLSWNLTIVGTLKKNKTFIPQEMKPSNSRKLLSTLFGFREKVTICSYVPKKNKAVILLSTMHNDAAISDLAHRKPEMILFYNKTKASFDTVDQMCMRYSTQRRTCRWVLAFFYNILDIACVAAYIIYYENNKMLPKTTNRRRLFLRQLSEELTMPMIEERASNQQIMRNHTTKIAVESYFEKPVTVVVTPGDQQPRDVTGRKVVVGSCYICNEQPIRKRRKTRKSCDKCKKPVCDEHSAKITKCIDCNR